MPRFLRILVRPEATWREIRATDPSAMRVFSRHVLPLALLPSIAWPIGRALEESAARDGIVAAFTATFLLSIACVLLGACGIYLLAPIFAAARNWQRACAVAAYSATPVLLCGALLFLPLLVIASVGGFLYGLALCAGGVRLLLDCKEGETAGYVAGVAVFLGVTSMALGALCSAIGLI